MVKARSIILIFVAFVVILLILTVTYFVGYQRGSKSAYEGEVTGRMAINTSLYLAAQRGDLERVKSGLGMLVLVSTRNFEAAHPDLAASNQLRSYRYAKEISAQVESNLVVIDDAFIDKINEELNPSLPNRNSSRDRADTNKVSMSYSDQSGPDQSFLDQEGKILVYIMRGGTDDRFPAYEGIKLLTHYVYRSDGNLQEKHEFYGNGRLYQSVLYRYSEDGEWLKGDIYDTEGKRVGSELTEPEVFMYGDRWEAERSSGDN